MAISTRRTDFLAWLHRAGRETKIREGACWAEETMKVDCKAACANARGKAVTTECFLSHPVGHCEMQGEMQEGGQDGPFAQARRTLLMFK